ncbi:hypothetical protein DWX51_15180 [Bacteroides uniformis]|jgi:hypothetical protein|uniref:Uncharacterized protein n=1 Tax=Bacteroides uniformis TaxID=820 RepID=A0A412BAE7_BACUN|nr:hypothetical protein DXD58_01890 [Bacteroides sp. D20]RGQ50304.1 hypothetical protein DWY92_12690 [Bacteroides uniformis]RGT11742.1 hypothetical protein DWX51_15180 [Bacteroides uniformis]RHC04966.1 hypothetical protein DW861_08270 [Bacteroides uniformis]RHE01543.1 hypothetical protein DW771_15455 [Bacteroides uniformis]
MPQIYSFFLIPQQYHLLHLGIIYEQTPGKVLPGKAQFPFFSPLSSNAKMYEMHISYNTKYASRTLTHYSLRKKEAEIPLLPHRQKKGLRFAG